jgi:hypothetical protein
MKDHTIVSCNNLDDIDECRFAVGACAERRRGRARSVEVI